jgi:hypothetical protein
MECKATAAAIKAAEMAASFALVNMGDFDLDLKLDLLKNWGATLYCVGGLLDGEVKSAWHLYTAGLMTGEHYKRREFVTDGHKVAFWVLAGMPDSDCADRARELFTDAAVLQDEQLICE